MTKELKTLKDIETLDMKERAFANSIRKEAIKWVKDLRQRNGSYQYIPSAEDIMMEFFNITEDDLKVTRDLK